MPTYRVEVTQTIYLDLDVEARNKREAEEIALAYANGDDEAEVIESANSVLDVEVLVERRK